MSRYVRQQCRVCRGGGDIWTEAGDVTCSMCNGLGYIMFMSKDNKKEETQEKENQNG